VNRSAHNQASARSAGVIDRLRRIPAGVRWGFLGALVLLVLLGGWLAIGALQAKSNLEQARSAAEQSKDALLSGNSEEAVRFAENAQFHADRARSATHSLPWNIAAAVPLLGSPMKATQQIADVVAGLADSVLLPTAAMGSAITPDSLIHGTRLDLNLLREQEPRLNELSTAAATLNVEAQAIAEPAYLSVIGDARTQLQEQTSSLAQLLGNTAIAAKLAPSMLGADRPQTYLMGFQTNAEARGTGGLLGGFGILRFDRGVPTVDTLAPNTELSGAKATVDLGPEFDKVYGWTNPYTDFRNSNLSPHFPHAAQIWKSMWESESGVAVDGVIALDPIALSYVLGVIGPVKLPDGEVINQDNVVELTESTAYIRFPTDQTARKQYLQQIANAVVQRMTGSIPSPRQLLGALGRAAGERRIAVWSANPADQRILEQTPLAHVVPQDDAPYAQVVINNLAGNKMDYYLKREIGYAADGCSGDMRNTTVTVKLTNESTGQPLPEYVAGALGLIDGIPMKTPSGTMVTSVRLIATNGAKLMSVTSGGQRTPAVTRVEEGHPSYEVQVAIPPGQSGELIFRLSEPTVPGAPRVPIQPLIDDVAPRVEVPICTQ